MSDVEDTKKINVPPALVRFERREIVRFML